MWLLLVFVMAMQLMGCTDDTIYPLQVTNAQTACVQFGGWVSIMPNSGARCANGTYISYGVIYKAAEVRP